MCDDTVDTPAVERYGTVKLRQQRDVLGQVLSTDATTLLALREHIVPSYPAAQHVHQHGNTRAIIGTEHGLVCIPLARGLAYLVRPVFTMYCVNVGNEQGAVRSIDTSVNVQVTYLVIAYALSQMCGQMGLKPVGEHCYALAFVWALD